MFVFTDVVCVCPPQLVPDRELRVYLINGLWLEGDNMLGNTHTHAHTHTDTHIKTFPSRYLQNSSSTNMEMLEGERERERE